LKQFSKVSTKKRNALEASAGGNANQLIKSLHFLLQSALKYCAGQKKMIKTEKNIFYWQFYNYTCGST
jgi:hypothetical protein